MSIRVAVIGCGRMGNTRADASLECGAKVVAVTDADEQRARGLAQRAGAKWFTSVDEMPWAEVDAAFLCTPPAFRLEAVRLASTYATPILVEKPLALDAPSAWAMVMLAQQAQMVTAVGYMNRHRSTVAMARHLARTGSLVGVSCNWSSKQYAVPWWRDSQSSGGPINEQATHIIDLCRFIGGEVAEVVALGTSGENRLAAALLFKGGAVGTIFYTCEAAEKNISLELTTTSGHMRLAGWDFLAETNTIDGSLPCDDRSPFLQETSTFLESATLRKTDGIRCTFEDAYRTQLVVDAIREAAGTRHRLAAAG